MPAKPRKQKRKTKGNPASNFRLGGVRDTLDELVHKYNLPSATHLVKQLVLRYGEKCAKEIGHK